MKPQISQQAHLLTAALIWSGVGSFLLYKALLRFPPGLLARVLLVLCIVLAGMLKSRGVLDRIAEKNIVRIQQFTGPRFIGEVYPVATWLKVSGMIAIGVVLKYLPLPTILLSFIYGTVGWALLFSSRHNWRVWQRFRRREKE